MKAPRRWFLFIVLLALAWPALVSAHPATAEIAATWTGLEYNGRLGGSRLFTLVLAADVHVATPVPRAAQTGHKLTGTWTAQPIARDRRGRQLPPVVEMVTAEYFPGTGILRLTRRPERGGAGSDCLAVFDVDVGRLAGVYTGGRKADTPFYAARGSTLPPELAAVTGLEHGQLIPEALSPEDTSTMAGDWRAALAEAYASGDYARARRIAGQQSPGPARPAVGVGSAARSTSPPPARDHDAEMLALQAKVQEAARRGDTNEIKRLQKEMKELRAAAAAQRQPGTRPPPAVAAPSTGSRCPEHIVAWAGQLDTYGGSVEHFEGNNPLANLFRPRLFAPFFGRPFAALSANDRAKIGRDLQSRCVLDGTPLGRGSAIGAMISAFQDTPGYTVAEAGLAGLALELIADWNLRSVRDLGVEPDAARVADFEVKSTQLVAHLFPREREETRQQLVALKSRDQGRRLLAEIDSLGRAASAGNAEAMERLVHLPRHADAANLSAADRAPFDEKHATTLAASAAAFIARARAEMFSVPPGLDQLIRGKAWLAAHGDVLNALRGRPEADAFQREFTAARIASYAVEHARLTREIDALDTWEGLARHPLPFEILSDTTTSPVWREIDAQRHAKLAAVERREFLVRTGDGPFGPEHPGAIYLNALWRNDQALIEKLDQRYREPFLTQLGWMEQIDYTPDLAAMFTGEPGAADRQRRLRRALLQEASLANVLLVAFAFGYEEVYPACMDAEPVEFRIHVQRERIVRNLMGHYQGSRPDGVTTITHRVNQRHAPAVADLRIADPNDTVLGETLFGRIDQNTSFVHVGAGLARAMRDHACDSDVIRRIETGLLARWEIHAERKRAIQQRFLGEFR